MNKFKVISLYCRTSILFISIVSATQSCTFFDDTFSDTKNPSEYGQEDQIGENSGNTSNNSTTNVKIENLDLSKSRTSSDIEVIWQIPETPVEGYVVNYGFEQNNLTKQVRVRSEILEKAEDPKHGFVYRYVLSGIPLNKIVYISISAYNGSSISTSSEIFKVMAN